jgi:molecular chaperone DnaK
MIEPLVQRSMGPCKQALADAGLTPDKIDEVVLVGGQTRMPAVQNLVKGIYGKEPHKGVNPDEVVAVGAAIQAGVLGGEVKDILLLDVTPLTLAIETLGGIATAIIPRNTTIPTSKSQIFSTASDNQPSVEINVTQGERPMSAENRSLGRFILDGILPAPRGLPQIEVTFDIDANGILSVAAKDKGTGREQKIAITASSGLSKDEVARMVREGELHAAEDQKRREDIETRNQADTLAYQADKTLRDYGDKIPADVKEEISGKVAAVRSALQGQDVAYIRRTMQDLSYAMQKIGSAVYGQPGGPGGPAGPGAGGPPPGGEEPRRPDEGTVEGEYREV